MAMSDAGRTNDATDGYRMQPHAYDPSLNPEYFDGVLARRTMAFFVDLMMLVLPVLAAILFIALFGVVTLGLGWLLFWLLPAATVIWAVVYYGLCFGSPASATLGMRLMDIEMRTWYGAPAYFVLGAVHAVLYWVLVSALTPLVLLVGLFNERGRLVHDFLLGTVVVNNEVRAEALRLTRGPYPGAGPRDL